MRVFGGINPFPLHNPVTSGLHYPHRMMMVFRFAEA
ncbi:Hypothetical protein BIBO2_1149 [Brucella sp. BO2]|nr:Hypothetical protein BIBO2_1149 [Brucella sp. BO2]